LTVLQESGWAMDTDVAWIRERLSVGFRWHEPERAHDPVRTDDAWWDELRPLVRDLGISLGVPPGPANDLLDGLRRRFLDPALWHLYPDVLPCLETLDARAWRMDIASNNIPELESMLLRLGLRRRFNRVHCSAWMGYEKPHPEFFRLATAGLAPGSRIWMVGDNAEADVSGARRQGLRAVLVRKPAPGVEPYLDDLTRLPELLERA